MSPTIEKPIMIACAGRSGSTLYYRMLAQHRDLGWLSTWNQMAPRLPCVSMFSSLYRHNVFARIRNRRYFPKPFSPYRFWEQYLPGIARHDRPLVPSDVPKSAVLPVRQTIARVLRYQGKRRFLMKVTGWARMAYFDRVFPGMRFIYLRRDPIAIMSSWIKAGWLNVTSDLDSPGWEWGEVPKSYRMLYRELGGGKLLSAAVKTQLDIDDLRRNAVLFPDRCFELDYEDLVRDPVRHMKATAEFCELDWDEDFERVVRSTIIVNYSQKWKSHLSTEEADRVREFFEQASMQPSGV